MVWRVVLYEVTVAGCGPGAAEMIAGAVFQAGKQCDVLIGPQRLLEHFADAGGGKKLLKQNYQEMLDWIAGHRNKHTILVLVTGDPLIHSFGKMVVDKIGIKSCRIIPGISSVQYALAKMGRNWMGVKIINLHGKTCPDLADQIKKFSKLAILTDGEKSARDVFQILSTMQLGERFVYLCENLSLETETIRLIDPIKDVPDKIAPLHLILVLKPRCTG